MRRIQHALLTAIALTSTVHIATGMSLDTRQFLVYTGSLFAGVMIYLSIVERRRRK